MGKIYKDIITKDSDEYGRSREKSESDSGDSASDSGSDDDTPVKYSKSGYKVKADYSGDGADGADSADDADTKDKAGDRADKADKKDSESAAHQIKRSEYSEPDANG